MAKKVKEKILQFGRPDNRLEILQSAIIGLRTDDRRPTRCSYLMTTGGEYRVEGTIETLRELLELEAITVVTKRDQHGNVLSQKFGTGSAKSANTKTETPLSDDFDDSLDESTVEKGANSVDPVL